VSGDGSAGGPSQIRVPELANSSEIPGGPAREGGGRCPELSVQPILQWLSFWCYLFLFLVVCLELAGSYEFTGAPA
jgi:hypothetical protein